MPTDMRAALHPWINEVTVAVKQALTVGSKVWGAVAEVTAKELIISLPHGLRGHVAPAEASPAYSLPDNSYLCDTLASKSASNH